GALVRAAGRRRQRCFSEPQPISDPRPRVSRLSLYIRLAASSSPPDVSPHSAPMRWRCLRAESTIGPPVDSIWGQTLKSPSNWAGNCSGTPVWSDQSGDVAEQADAKVSKTFEINSRVGSIPTIPIDSASGFAQRNDGGYRLRARPPER